VVEVVELVAIVEREEAEITAVVEEGDVLRRGPLILSPSGGEEYCGVGAPPPSVPIEAFRKVFFPESFVHLSVRTFPKQHPPSMVRGGVVFGVYILWVSNSAPRRPLDASQGRPSLTSYNEIASVPL
jgi:hypothetical protein